MKITKLILVVTALTLAVVSCKKSSQDLTNAIPANAGYVVHINGKSIVEKSNYDIFKNVTVQRGINMAKAMIGNNQDAVNMIDAFTKDVNSIGLDIKGDSYFYTDYASYGFVMGVNDAEKLKNSILNIPGAKEQEMVKVGDDGIYTISTGANAVIVWNKDKFIALGSMGHYFSGGDKDQDLLAVAKKQLTQEDKESINSNPAFANFLKDQKDITVFYSYSPEMIKNMLAMSRVDLPEEILNELNELKGASSIASVSFDKGQITADGKIYYESSDAEKKYKDMAAAMSGSLKGDQLKYISENPIFLTSVNLKGAGIYDLLKKWNLLKDVEPEAAKEGFDLQALMSNVEGDITFALTDILSVTRMRSWGESKSSFPEFTVLVDLKNGKETFDIVKSKLAEADSAREGENEGAPKAIDENTYTADIDGTKGYFGIANNMLYITNSEKIFNGVKSSTPVSAGYDALAKNNMMLMTGNIQSLKAPLLKEIRDNEAKGYADEFVSLFGNYDYTGSVDMGGKGKIEMTDKSQNSLAAICKYLDNVLTGLNDKMGF